MFKQLFSTALGAASLLGASAMAQEVSSFGGPFIGGEAGLQRNKFDITAPGNVHLKDSDKGYNIRGFAGYDFNIDDQFVLGAELGIGRGGPDVNKHQGTAQFNADPGLMFDASARAGFLVTPSTLLYGRVGYANAKVDVNASNSAITDGTASQDKRKGGILYGIGAEFAVLESFRLRTEYRRSKNGDLKSDQALVGVIFDF